MDSLLVFHKGAEKGGVNRERGMLRHNVSRLSWLCIMKRKEKLHWMLAKVATSFFVHPAVIEPTTHKFDRIAKSAD